MRCAGVAPRLTRPREEPSSDEETRLLFIYAHKCRVQYSLDTIRYLFAITRRRRERAARAVCLEYGFSINMGGRLVLWVVHAWVRGQILLNCKRFSWPVS